MASALRIGRRWSSRRRLNAIVAGAFVALVAFPALAAEIAGVKLEDKASLAGRDLVLNGAGLRTRLVFKVYVASLYTPSRAGDAAAVLAQAPRRVRLDLLRDLSASQLVDALLDGLKDNSSEAELAAIQRETDELVAIMQGFGEVKQGSVVTLDFVDGSTRIAQDGQPKGSIAGEPFNRALMRIWIGDRPVQADLKKALLGG